MPSSLLDRIRTIQSTKKSVLCVGLDPDPNRLPHHLTASLSLPEAILRFNAELIEATQTIACAFKVNFAFYEALGREGWHVLNETRRLIPSDALAIADAKRGDIGNTARFYADAILHELNYDAITVAPYMGRDAVRPFLSDPEKLVFVLGRTSNPGSADFQERDSEGMPLYERVARTVASWDAESPGVAGLVVGATSPTALSGLRALCPAIPFLIPGVGAQGGDPAAVMTAATPDGLVFVNSSRGIIYASEGRDFAASAHDAARRLSSQLVPN